MADASLESAAARRTARVRWGPWGRVALGVGVVAAELALFAGYRALFARLEWSTIAGQRFPDYLYWYPEVVLATLIGYALVVPGLSRRAAHRDLDALAPALETRPAELERLHSRLGSIGSGLPTLGAALGALGGVALTFSPGIWAAGHPPGFEDPDLSWGLVRNPVMFGLVFRAVLFEVELARFFSGLGGRHARVDLLDLQPLAPFARRGLTTVLVYFLLGSIASLTALGPWKADTTLVSLAVLAAIGVAALGLPMRGVRARIRRAKQAELARLRASIREQRSALLGAAPSSSAGVASLADLLAWEARVERVREWPFDAPSLLRFVLYLGLPLGSWLGGALVERLLGAALD